MNGIARVWIECERRQWCHGEEDGEGEELGKKRGVATENCLRQHANEEGYRGN